MYLTCYLLLVLFKMISFIIGCARNPINVFHYFPSYFHRWSQSGLTDGVTRVQRSQSKRKSNIPMKTYPKSQDKESLLQGVENA